MQNINPKLILNKVLNKNNDDYDRQILDNYTEKYNGHPEFNSNMINNSIKYSSCFININTSYTFF